MTEIETFELGFWKAHKQEIIKMTNKWVMYLSVVVILKALYERSIVYFVLGEVALYVFLFGLFTLIELIPYLRELNKKKIIRE